MEQSTYEIRLRVDEIVQRLRTDEDFKAKMVGDAEGTLQVADLHRQSRLGHGAGLGGAAEMAVFGERGEITKLSKRDHPHQIN